MCNINQIPFHQQKMLILNHVLLNMDYCESLFSGHLWIPLKSCSLSSSLNPNSQIVDSSIINVLQFAPSSDQSYFSVLSLEQSGSIQNAIILVNTSLSSNQNQIFVFIFSQLSGKLNNVTLTGFVNVSALPETEINFSPFGTVNGDLINYPENWNGDFTFKNVSNNLKLFVNGIEISITGDKIKVNQDVNTSNSNFNIGGVEHKSVLIKNKIINENHSKVIYFGFKIIEGNNNNTNALMDLYLIPHKISIEKYYEINSLKVYNFNTDGTLASQKADFTIFIQNTKAVADSDSKTKVCSGKYIYDIKTKLCITREQCHSKPNQLIFQSTCAIQCPDTYVVFNKTCFSQCPQWLGAYPDSSSSACAQCPSNQLATESGCVQSCSSFAFKYGCYQNCPAGTVVQGKTCTEPSSISECGSGEYLVLTGMLDGQRFYNTCETTGPSWMYRLVDQNDVQTNVYKAECRGLILPNNDCQELGSPSEITNSGWCEEQCEIGEYFQPELQICHECLGDIYDGGLYFERNGLKCVSSCSKWSLSGTKKICEDKFPNNCPVWQVISAGQFQCQTSCSSSQFQDGQVCSSCDPALNKQVDKDNGGCLCQSGYFTLNTPDGSFTCTECNTTLNFKPSKEGSICKCLDNAIYQDNKCIIQCTSTQVILPGATSCSTCPQNTIPNVAQDGCVATTGCAPGFLNVAGTFCVSSCASDSSIDGPSNQCVSCASKDPLTQFSSGQCVCVPGASKATSSASCACNQNFSPASGACSCSKKLSSDGQTCSDKCPAAEASISGNAKCSTCGSKVSNVDQTACVDKTACSPGYLNQAQTHCVSDCAQDKAAAGSNNQCVSCSSINALSVFGSSSCVCAPNAVGSMPSCTCNTANGFSGAGCSCSKKLSVDGSVCKDSCPSTEVSISGASQCSTCPQNTIPNVAQDGCVATTGCAPGFLNVAGTFCVSSCASDSSIDGPSNQCVSCASKDPLTQFSSGQCVCVPGASKATSSASCACNQNFSPASGACSCSKKLSSDGQTCSDKCPAAEVSISGNAKCSTCGSKVSNVDQTACVDKTACSPGFLNLAETFCIANCASDKSGVDAQNQCKPCQTINALSVFKDRDTGCSCIPRATGSITSCTCNTAAGFVEPGCTCSQKISSNGASCEANCPSTEVSISGTSQCSTCPQNTVPNVAQDGCVEKTACAPGFLNLAQTFCISSCSSQSAGSNSENQCTPCVTLDPLSSFVVSGCACVPGAFGSVPNCACRQGFSTALNACTCSQKISSDWTTCTEKCPSSEVILSGATTCSICSGQVPNVDQTACVDKTACSPGYLNQAQTHCVSDCAQDKAAAGSNNQCVSCSSINALFVFGSSSCVCAPNAVGSMPSCTCNTANGFSGAGCSCSKKLSVDGSVCKDSCPSTEVSISGASQCSTCPQNTIPNVAQDGCVATTGCAPGFLNVAGTFCVSSCASDSSIDGPSNQCVSCASKDPLTQFSSGQCVCVPGASKATSSASCACNQNFSPASGACSCSKKLSSDGQTCSDKCPAAEVSISGNAKCSTCASDFIPDEQQLECKKIIDTCPNNQYISLNQYQCVSSCVGGYIDETKCVQKCTDKLVDVSLQRCVTQCGANQLQISGYCKCSEAYIAKENQCECNSNGGYSIIDGVCKCDRSLGRITVSNQCVCDSYRGLAISGSQNICSCNTNLGFKSGSSISNCLCDVDKGFVLEPQLEDQGFVCGCNSAKGYKLNPRSIKPTCIKENKSMPIIGGVIGGILFLISLIVLLLYYKKKKQQNNNNTNSKQTSQKVKQLKVKVSNKQERAPKILKLNQIQKNESISSVNKVQMMPIFQEQNNVQNYVDEQLIDNQSQYQQEQINAVDAELNIVSSPSDVKSKRASQLTSRMSQSRLQKSGFDQNAASTVLQSHFIDQSAQFDQIQLLQNEYISNNSSSRNQSSLSQKQQPGQKDNKKKLRRPEINAESFQGKKIDTQTIKNNIQLMQNRTKGLEPMKRSMKQVKMM
ncbi:VSP_with INR [Hexamita inflata]|uniref:VSP with INR n=1 Tax=Hexamita inflata TaxID=28002 RepID=A0AA86TCQ8_9EUKA|nr:VSP with INR [Hexamita inflata]